MVSWVVSNSLRSSFSGALARSIRSCGERVDQVDVLFAGLGGFGLVDGVEFRDGGQGACFSVSRSL
jgi:hypothetical protein